MTRLVSETRAYVSCSWTYLSDIFSLAVNGYKLAMKDLEWKLLSAAARASRSCRKPVLASGEAFKCGHLLCAICLLMSIYNASGSLGRDIHPLNSCVLLLTHVFLGQLLGLYFSILFLFRFISPSLRHTLSYAFRVLMQ